MMDDYMVSVLAKQRMVDAVREAEACRAAERSRAPRRAVRLVLGQALMKLGARLVRGLEPTAPVPTGYPAGAAASWRETRRA
jgi:hypothetical protein